MKAKDLTMEERMLYAPLYKSVPIAIVAGAVLGFILNLIPWSTGRA